MSYTDYYNEEWDRMSKKKRLMLYLDAAYMLCLLPLAIGIGLFERWFGRKNGK